MQLALLVEGRGAIVRHRLRHQVPAIAGRVDAHVLGRRHQAALERGLELAVARLAGVEGEVVAEENEAVGGAAQCIEDPGELHEVGLVHLDHAQTPAAEAPEQALHRRGLPRAPLPVEQHVIRGQAAHELVGVGEQPLDRPIDTDQVVEIEEVRLLDGEQAPGAPAGVPAEGEGALEGGAVPRRSHQVLQDPLAELEDALHARDECSQATHGNE